MKIELSAAGKRFNYDWIFRNVNLQFASGTSYAITGPNGSGKSTLLQVIGGLSQLSEGSIGFVEAKNVDPEIIYQSLSLCAPYLEVIEEMTVVEFLNFHAQFKSLLPAITIDDIIEIIGLKAARNKQIRYYSSGMKQRVKLAQAIFSATPILLLDEPCSNLDSTGIELYHSLIENYCKERLIIVCSNDPVEYDFCQTILSMADYKTTIPA
jgi:ABC-type multidrug transport system ATPase subunit